MPSLLRQRAINGTKASILAEALRVDQEWQAKYQELQARFDACQGLNLENLKAYLDEAQGEIEDLASQLKDAEGQLWELKAKEQEHHPLCLAYNEDGARECICKHLEPTQLNLGSHHENTPPLTRLTH